MIYLIYQDWSNTSNNHTDIKYSCNQIQEMYFESYKALVIPALRNDRSKSPIRVVASLQYHFVQYKHRLYTKKLYNHIMSKLRKGDKVILMEHMEKLFPVLHFVQKVKRYKSNIPLYAMVHFVPNRLERRFSDKKTFDEWIICIDKLLTLGHSLTQFLITKGLPEDKVVTTSHHVDEYYHNKRPVRLHKNIRVMAMGNQMRNLKLLKTVVDNNPNVNFTTCQGVNNLSSYFPKNTNVELIPFVEESELRQHMADADISLNVMEDTVGSSVIVTSLAMGLAMICNSAGSIKDYCGDSNTIFCNNSNVEDFSQAITAPQADRARSNTMRQPIANIGLQSTIEKFMKQISVL